MILSYRPSVNGSDPYHFGITNGLERKFIRVIVGTILPLLDRQAGAAIVLGENYRVMGPASWVAFDAICSIWAPVENRLMQWRSDLKFTHVVVDAEPAKRVIYDMKGLSYGLSEIPMGVYAAPDHFDTEVGRSLVDELIKERRLVLPYEVQRSMALEKDGSKGALQAAMTWAKRHPATYAPIRKPRRTGNIIGLEGL